VPSLTNASFLDMDHTLSSYLKSLQLLNEGQEEKQLARPSIVLMKQFIVAVDSG